MNVFEDVSDHDLRQIFCEWLCKTPGELKDAAELAGWQDDLAALRAEIRRREGD